MADEYKQATKRQKGKILDILTALTGYTIFRTPRGGYDNGRDPWMRRMSVWRGRRPKRRETERRRVSLRGWRRRFSCFRLRFEGIDSDSDSAFINNHLVRYCTEKKITFIRSRPSRTTTALLSRRTTPWCGERLASTGAAQRKTFKPSTTCMWCCGFSRTAFNR